jgi:hypothetical protein
MAESGLAPSSVLVPLVGVAVVINKLMYKNLTV